MLPIHSSQYPPQVGSVIGRCSKHAAGKFAADILCDRRFQGFDLRFPD